MDVRDYMDQMDRINERWGNTAMKMAIASFVFGSIVGYFVERLLH